MQGVIPRGDELALVEPPDLVVAVGEPDLVVAGGVLAGDEQVGVAAGVVEQMCRRIVGPELVDAVGEDDLVVAEDIGAADGSSSSK